MRHFSRSPYQALFCLYNSAWLAATSGVLPSSSFITSLSHRDSSSFLVKYLNHYLEYFVFWLFDAKGSAPPSGQKLQNSGETFALPRFFKSWHTMAAIYEPETAGPPFSKKFSGQNEIVRARTCACATIERGHSITVVTKRFAIKACWMNLLCDFCWPYGQTFL